MALFPTIDSTTTAITTPERNSDKKGADVSVSPVDAPHRPMFGRRKTTSDAIPSVVDAQKLGYGHEDNGLTKIGNFVWKIHSASLLTRYTLYILPIALILAVPIIVLDTVYERDERLCGNVDLLGLFIWFEVLWVILWIAKLIAMIVPRVFQAICGIISGGIRKYTAVLVALEIPLSLFIWTIGAWGSSHVITFFEHGKDGVCTGDNWRHQQSSLTENPCSNGWPGVVRKVLLAGIVVNAIFLAEKTFVQLIAIDYHRKQYD